MLTTDEVPGDDNAPSIEHPLDCLPPAAFWTGLDDYLSEPQLTRCEAD